ncbi:hypothetical protein Ais01nite_80710 [Asanoa ishikariensis]|uniref:Uncharacterized protein n=1 Tax=Asanoa ishikariensis TaxID=137265 RepID=A0A1H3UY49_9ACTN|nr:hypothetical protein [Asanoa ishikariensis]GIF70036.1 hypothetical protein Ais01nite_80710 [Asanoa ishikariensis]SDZ67353.1 hypothetical protein SAMN05421684_8413 [Asanoa ishikariensis]
MDLEGKRQLRTILAKWIYDKTGGNEYHLAETDEFKVPDGWSGPIPSEDDVAAAIKWLEGEHLVRPHWTMDGLPSVQITHYGVTEMEEAISDPKTRTEHFVPLVNITNIHGSVYGSQIQQGSPGATQTGTFTFDQRNDVEAFIAAARQLLDNVSADVRTRTGADLDAMDRELKDGNPRAGILQALGREVRAALIAAAGSTAVQTLSAIQWP